MISGLSVAQIEKAVSNLRGQLTAFCGMGTTGFEPVTSAV
jgi:hypothetical protein